MEEYRGKCKVCRCDDVMVRQEAQLTDEQISAFRKGELITAPRTVAKCELCKMLVAPGGEQDHDTMVTIITTNILLKELANLKSSIDHLTHVFEEKASSGGMILAGGDDQ